MMKKEEAVVVETQQVTEYDQQRQSVEQMIMTAIEKGVPIETMERILAMRTQLKEENAREQFIKAMANFQSQCPVIKKAKEVKDKYGKIRYSYAPLDSIVAQIKEILRANGLSYSIKTTSDKDNLTATCIVSHSAGHSEQSSFIVPLGNEEYMTDVQKFGARSTFAKRYAFCDAFGILTGDLDNDAINATDATVVNEDEVEKAKEAIKKCLTPKSFNETFASLDKSLKANREVLETAKKVKELIQENGN